MADQFCRIATTTLSNDTLGTDASQTLLTTDANTSFVIRDVFKKDSCAVDALSSTLALEMDGVDIASGIVSSASGSIIIPPSSTVCIKETSANYPLCYTDSVTSELHNYCGQDTRAVTTCEVNGVPSGTASEQTFCRECYSDCLCAQSTPMGFQFFPQCCFSIFVRADYSSGNCVQIHDHANQNTVRTCGFSSQPAFLNNGIFGWGNSYTNYLYDMEHRTLCCGCALSTALSWCTHCNYSACGNSTNAKFAISSPHPCHGRRCRAVIRFSGGSCHSHIIFTHVNLDTGVSGVLGQRTGSNFTNSCICNGVNNNNTSFYSWYSTELDKWMAALTFHNNWIVVFDQDMVCAAEFAMSNEYVQSCPTMYYNDETHVYYPNGQTCRMFKVPLSSIEKGNNDGAIDIGSGSPTWGNTSCGVRHISVTKATATDQNSSSYSVNPTTSVGVYGIKST